jgi:hypothetical protein
MKTQTTHPPREEKMSFFLWCKSIAENENFQSLILLLIIVNALFL